MTPTRKLRTTAIAALVAVSTVFSGVTPAIAAPAANSVNSTSTASFTQPAGLNIYDGSKLNKGTVKSEDALKVATDNVAKQIEGFGKDESEATLAAVFAAYEGNPDLAKQKILGAVNLTEEGALEALTARFNEITKTLEVAAQNQADAHASVTAALDADIASKKAFKVLKDYLNNLSTTQLHEINTLIANVNVADAQDRAINSDGVVTSGNLDSGSRTGLAFIPAIHNVGKNKMTDEEVSNFAHIVIKRREQIRDLKADQGQAAFVDRYYSKAFEKFLNSDLVKGFLDPYEASQRDNIAAQNTDILPLEMFLERSRAQVLVLRLIQARYAIAVRLIELYENDVLGNNGAQGLETVKEAYIDAVNNSKLSLDSQEKSEREELKEADKAAEDWFVEFGEDLKNDYTFENDEEYKTYVTKRTEGVERTYANINKDRTWQTILEKAQLKDQKYFAEQKDYAKIERDSRILQERNEALQRQIEDLKKQIAGTNGDHNNTTDTGKNDSGKSHNHGDDEFPFVPLAIGGVVIALIAALAAHFPVILAALPKI